MTAGTAVVASSYRSELAAACHCGRTAEAAAKCGRCHGAGPTETQDRLSGQHSSRAAVVAHLWTPDEIKLLAWSCSVGASPDDGSALLGISPRKYLQACELFNFRHRVVAGERACLMCNVRFESPDIAAVRVCDACKATTTWRLAGWLT